MKRLLTALLLTAASWVPACAGIINSIGVTRSDPTTHPDLGTWSLPVGGSAFIGVTNTGSPNNPWLNPNENSVSISSGTYLLFFGAEDHWTGMPGTPRTDVTLTLGYTDGSTRSAVFTQGELTTAGNWTRTSGDSLLTLGSAGITGVDHMSITAYAPNQVNDIVLQFSDGGTSAVPEPASFGLAAGGLAIGFAVRRWRRQLGRR